MNWESIWQLLTHQGLDLVLKLVGAITTWTIGRWVLTQAMRVVSALIDRGRRMDPTLAKYLKAVAAVVLHVLLIVVVLDIFGISTTSLAALLAGAGLAVGAAWGGLLRHFAAGIYLQLIRPYQVGDLVSLGGIQGRVEELGLFNTRLINNDNVLTVVGNDKIFTDTVHNFSAMPARRVECLVKIAHGVDVTRAMETLRAAVQTIAHVCTEPPPEVGIWQFTAEGPLLCVRPYTPAEHYWQVYFDTHRSVALALAEGGFPPPQFPLSLNPH
jgi:small conductance mechanosensitive channel